jgi:hypothetical protein
MVESRIKEICLSAMESKFPEFKVKDFAIRKTFKFEDKTQDWVDDSYAIFIQIVSIDGYSFKDLFDVESYLVTLFGFEFCVDFSEN